MGRYMQALDGKMGQMVTFARAVPYLLIFSKELFMPFQMIVFVSSSTIELSLSSAGCLFFDSYLGGDGSN